jgi:lipopolysaccharide/colanic/teichoic acid biosynthesis glycosyltransferase
MEMNQPVSPYLYSRTKRLLDLGFTLLIAPVALSVFIVAAIVVYLTSGSPVLFRQVRVGMGGKPFKMVKIRTLSLKFASLPGAQHGANDITRVGKFLRKMRIDEIPQLLTILKGEMSWVGPRPEVAFYYEEFQAKDSRFRDRLHTKPGITGLAQINNPNASPNENLEKLQHDLKYIESATFALDLKILAKSFLVIWKY